MMRTMMRFLREENGEDLMEYGLLAAFVASIALLVIINDAGGVRTALASAYHKAADVLHAAEGIRSP